jgi:hypothetical protein
MSAQRSPPAIPAAFERPAAFNRDRILTLGASAAWLDPERWIGPIRRALVDIPAPITRLIENG